MSTAPEQRISRGLNQQGEAHASLSSLLVYRNRCCKRSSRNDSPKEDEGKNKKQQNNNTSVFPGEDIAVEPPKSQGLIRLVLQPPVRTSNPDALIYLQLRI